MTCSIEGCEVQIHTAGMCNRHYQRVWKYGDPHFQKTTKGLPLDERIRRLTKVDANGCMVFTGKVHDKMGYGRITVKKRMFYIHRVAWELVHGPIPAGMVVLHSCDNAPCANVDHLSIGTQKDNVRDMFAKGRVDRRGDRSNTAHLNWDQVHEIRRLAKQGATRRQLHEQFQICVNQVSNIINNKHWIEETN